MGDEYIEQFSEKKKNLCTFTVLFLFFFQNKELKNI